MKKGSFGQGSRPLTSFFYEEADGPAEETTTTESIAGSAESSVASLCKDFKLSGVCGGKQRGPTSLCKDYSLGNSGMICHLI
jgi:hypothetical protein